MESNLQEWNALALQVEEEGTIGDIVCLINMLNMNETKGRNDLCFLKLKTACLAPWKMGIGKVWKPMSRKICSLLLSICMSIVSEVEN